MGGKQDRALADVEIPSVAGSRFENNKERTEGKSLQFQTNILCVASCAWSDHGRVVRCCVVVGSYPYKGELRGG